MDQETLYTASKWQILSMLETGSKSPLEIAKLAGISLTNVSQQLRLLEMAGLVTSERVPNRGRGQPRLLYSLAGNNCYIISTASNLVQKKRLEFSASNKIILKIWFLENPQLRAFAERAFWRLEEYLPHIKAILIDADSTSPISYYVVPRIVPRDGRNSKLPIDEIQELRYGDETCQLTVTQTTATALNDLDANLLTLYDPDGLFSFEGATSEVKS